jgi:pimeloyl-ACP methyl ester carboxylesterase
MEIARYGKSHAYVFENELSDKLIITIEGSGWDSVLGTKNEKKWLVTHDGAQFLQVLRDRYTFFIPEKFGRQPGFEYSGDMEDRAKYTADNLLACYLESINEYLVEHSFSSIVLIGSSEGGILLPLIYEGMNNKDLVTAMVSISYGGLSLFECYRILANDSVGLPEGYKEMYLFLTYYFNPESGEFKDRDTFEEDVYGFTFRWFNSFKNIRPFDYYKNINIPVLFVHGETDYNIPVHSTIYLQQNLPEKPFTYKYFKWEHETKKIF